MSEKFTVKDYLAKVNPTFDVTLPSGAVFTLRKITARDFLKEGGAALQTSRQIEKTSPEATWEALTEEQKLKQIIINDKIIIKAVVTPQLKTGRSSDAYLGIDDISDIDYQELLKSVMGVSSDNNSLKTFPEESPTVDAGCNSKKVRSETITPIK